MAINTLDFNGAHNLVDEEYGTKTSAVIKDGKRIMNTNALPNHKTGAFSNPGNPNTISDTN